MSFFASLLIFTVSANPMFLLQDSLQVESWTSENPCSWKGVYCDWDNEVTSICLTNLNFTGDLPEGVFPGLLKIEYFSIANTLFLEIPLTVPSDVCASKSLKHFEIFNFSIESFPSQLLQCSELEVLSLTYTQISATLPNFASLKKLKVLELDHNSFSGEIPSSLAGLNNLEVVHLFNNLISGTLPIFLSKVLGVLDVRENRLTGEVDVRGE
jgi:Leucine-rich repeat (LRR) protein